MQQQITAQIARMRERCNSSQLQELARVVDTIYDYDAYPLTPAIHGGAVSKLVAKKDLERAVGILDPEGKAPNPFTGRPYSANYVKEAFKSRYVPGEKGWAELPIYPKHAEYIEAIWTNDVIMFTSIPGSGKTVLMPKFALHIYENYNAKVVCTSPKQITASSAGDYAAKMMDVEVGTYVGYKYKSVAKAGPDTRLLFATDGLLVAKQKSDPYFNEYDVIILDEAHERNVNIDLMLKLVKDAILQRKGSAKPLKFIIMSATIDTTEYERYFPAPAFKYHWLNNDKGDRTFPIQEFFAKTAINKFNAEGIFSGSADNTYIKAVKDILLNDVLQRDLKKHIVAFIPSGSDAGKICQTDFSGAKIKPYCMGLSKETRKEEQEIITKNTDAFRAAAAADGASADIKLVISTNVAESSLTIKNLEVVIDTGLANIKRFYPRTGVEAIEKRYIAKSNHGQRKGRTGRTMPGYCFNIFTEDEYARLFPDFAKPPILTDDVTEPIFDFISKNDAVQYVEMPFTYSKTPNAGSLGTFVGNLMTPPSPESVQYSIDQLLVIGALTLPSDTSGPSDKSDGKRSTLTEMGRAMAKFSGIGPQYARMILAANDLHCRANVIAIVAMMANAGEGGMDTYIYKPKTLKQRSKNAAKKSAADHEAERRYREAVDKFGVYNSDHLTMLNIYSHFITQVDKFKGASPIGDAPVDAEGKRGALELPREVGSWCAENSLNATALNEVRRFIFERNFGRVLDQLAINRQIERGADKNHYLYGQKHFYLFPVENNIAKIFTEKSLKHAYDDAPTRNRHIVLSLLFGSAGRVAVRDGKRFVSTYRVETVSAAPGQDSFMKDAKAGACIYGKIKGSPMGKEFVMATPITGGELALLPENIQAIMTAEKKT